MITLAPVFVGVVRCPGVDLYPEVQKLLFEDRGQLQLRRYLEAAVLQEDLDGGDEIPLWRPSSSSSRY